MKKKFYGALTGIIIVVAITTVVWFSFNGKASKPLSSDSGTEKSNSATATAAKEKEPAPEYSSKLVKAEKVYDIPVKAGQGVVAVPLKKINYLLFADGKRIQEIKADGSIRMIQHADPMAKSVGYGFERNQGEEEVLFVVCRYYGATPPENWFVEALKTVRL